MLVADIIFLLNLLNIFFTYMTFAFLPPVEEISCVSIKKKTSCGLPVLPPTLDNRVRTWSSTRSILTVHTFI